MCKGAGVWVGRKKAGLPVGEVARKYDLPKVVTPRESLTMQLKEISMKRIIGGVLALMAVWLAPVAVAAQDAAAVTGVVSDASGAVIVARMYRL